jgi:hypothetical protein
VATDDTDADGVCDAIDLCPNDADGMQEDVDGDGIGDACDNRPQVSNPGQQPAASGLDIAALDKNTFSWGIAQDVVYTRGDVLLVDSYTTALLVPLVQASQFTDGTLPGGGPR